MDGRDAPGDGREPAWWEPHEAPLTALRLWVRVLLVGTLGLALFRAAEWLYGNVLEEPW